MGRVVVSRLKVLMSAYACAPGKGSEPGVGWAVAREMARYHDIWVITRTNNRAAIEAELARNPQLGLCFVYWDLPNWARFWKRGRRGGHLYYYLWQLRILGIGRALQAEVGFDLIHHVTFVRYWAPSFLCFLDLPLVWGPVGGGESAPRSFWRGGGWWSVLYESSRQVARWVGEHGPFVRATARRSAVALGTTEETSARLRALGSKKVETFSQVGLLDDEFEQLGQTRGNSRAIIRFLSVGGLAHWKGCDISLRAFAQANIAGSEYWLIGDGRDRRRLEQLACALGIAERVLFLGKVPRHEVFSRLCECDVALHPWLHDSGGSASIEALAAGLPLICLDLGGPATQVTTNSGFKIPAHDPDQAARNIAAAMTALAQDDDLRRRLSRGARERVKREFCWSTKAKHFDSIYRQVLAEANERSVMRSSATSAVAPRKTAESGELGP
jgi:glycosyltransferase involved in cell wall biosynthesis